MWQRRDQETLRRRGGCCNSPQQSHSSGFWHLHSLLVPYLARVVPLLVTLPYWLVFGGYHGGEGEEGGGG